MPFSHLCFVRPASESKMSDRKEAIEKVKRRIKEIREKAAEKYSEDEITQKITDAFNGFVWEEKSQRKSETLSPASVVWFLLRCIKWLTLIVTLLILLCLGVYLAYLFNPYLSRRISNSIHDHNMAYYIARAFRFVSLPFHRVFDMKQVQKWPCLVKNPLYKPDPPNCDPCEVPMEVETYRSTDKPAKEATLNGDPIIITGEQEFKKVYNYTSLQQFYFKNKANLDFSACEIYGDSPGKKLTNFFTQSYDDVMASEKTFGWSNCRIEGTRALRKLFRRPSFVPMMSEVFLEKCMFFIHPKSTQTLTMPPCGTENCFIAQIYGSSEVRLVPFDECKENCTSAISTELKAGQILYHPETPWKITVDAMDDDLSIVYRSDFT